MKKQLIKLSEGLAIYFTKKDIEYLKLKEGQTIDLSDIFVIRGEYKPLPKNQTKEMIKKEVLK